MGARFPDLGQLMATVSIFTFILTPIIWYPEMMPEGSLRGTLMRFNPLYHFVEVFRAPILGDAVDHSSLWYVGRSEEHTSELQSLMRISYAVLCLKKKKDTLQDITQHKVR